MGGDGTETVSAGSVLWCSVFCFLIGGQTLRWWSKGSFVEVRSPRINITEQITGGSASDRGAQGERRGTYARKSWPQLETQCASSTATRHTKSFAHNA